MRRIRSSGTQAEMAVRRLVYGMGYRYRLHGKGLPGKPDLVFRKRKKAIFVHGCFWHQHPDPACADARLPKSRLGYWLPKLSRNQERDAQHLQELREGGWQSLVIWQCETEKQADRLPITIRAFLKG